MAEEPQRPEKPEEPVEAFVGDTIKFSFIDVPLAKSHLGTYDASEHGALTGNEYGPANIASTSKKIQWGTFENRPACLVGIELYCESPNRTIKKATFELNLVQDSKPSKSSDVYPRVVHFWPNIIAGKPSPVSITSRRVLNPTVTAGGVQVSVLETSQEKNIQREHMWTVKGSPLKRGPVHTGVRWILDEDKVQKAGVKHHVRVAVLFQHAGNPFQLQFFSGGKTGRIGEDTTGLGFLRKNRKGENDGEPEVRVFRPQESNQPLDIGMLDEFAVN